VISSGNAKNTKANALEVIGAKGEAIPMTFWENGAKLYPQKYAPKMRFKGGQISRG